MSDIKKARVTLSSNEIETAVKQYIQESMFPKLICIGNVELIKKEYGNVTAAVDVEPASVNPLSLVEDSVFYKLRHRTTKLFVESVTLQSNPKRLVLGVGMSGQKWANITDIFKTLKKFTTKPDFNGKIQTDQVLLDLLKEDLLHFEVVYFGETKADDITFHINELGKM